jgi:hypothetical protein
MRSSDALSLRGGRADARPTAWPLPTLAFAALAMLAASAPVHGQAEVAVPRPDPLQASAPVPPVVYRPVLASYRRAGELSVGSWREANDTVTRIGGWRVYTREAHAPEPPASAPAARPAANPGPPVPASAAGHGAHHGPVDAPPSGGRP